MLFRSSASPIGSRPGYATIDVPFDVVRTASSRDTSRADVTSLLANPGAPALDRPLCTGRAPRRERRLRVALAEVATIVPRKRAKAPEGAGDATAH
jgi:hypothetical protein